MSRSHSSNSSKKSNSRDKNRKQSEKDSSEIVSCLYVGNIDKKVTDPELAAHFKNYGELDYCYIVYEPSSSRQPQTKVSRGYGFVKFHNKEETIKAKNQLDGLQINGRRIKVEISKRNRPRQATPGRYLGRKRSPVRQKRRRSYSRSPSDQYRRRRQRKHGKHDRHEYRRRQYSRSRSKDRHKSKKRSYSRDRDRSPRKHRH